MTGESVEAAVQTAASFYIRQVQAKIAMGDYAMESVSCFCGGTDSIQMTQQDRYGFEYHMVMCTKCGILYANPRMTEASYQEFYKNEYRLIYDHGMDLDAAFMRCVRAGESLKSYLDDYEIHPKTIFDIGCNTGAWLKAFHEAGAEVLGVDYHAENLEYGRKHGLPVIRGGIEEIEATGKKADLVILNHVAEHFLDFERDMTRAGNLLADGGLLYVGVPGLYTWDLSELWQNAHTYQFNGDTLKYAMECCGFEEFYLDDGICSLWTKTKIKREKTDYLPAAAMMVENFLCGDRKMVPTIRAVSKFKVTDRTRYITAAAKSGTPNLDELGKVPADLEAMIIAGGPSVEGQLPVIRTLQAAGTKIIAIERMYPWCMRYGLVPDYVVVLDACDDVIDGFCALSTTTIHLVASQCQPTVLEALQGYPVYLFYTPQHGVDWKKIWFEEGTGDAMLINAGGSVSLCAFSLAMALGFRVVHFFGFDCHVGAGGYANGIVGVGDQKNTMEIDVKDRTFLTTSGYFAFAHQFFMLWKLGYESGYLDRVVVYGDSMVSAMAKDGPTVERNGKVMTMRKPEVAVCAS